MARATRSKKDDVYVENERERGRGLREGERINGEEAERKRGRVKRVGYGWYVGGGIQLIVGKLLTSDWNAP